MTQGADIETIESSELMAPVADTLWFQVVFWALHLFSYLSLAISAFAVFGRRMMDEGRRRLMMSFRPKDVYHLFGDTSDAVELGRDIAKNNSRSLVVLYSPEYSEELREEIASFGGALIKAGEGSKERLLASARASNPFCVVVFSGCRYAEVNGISIAKLAARKMVIDNPPYSALASRDLESGAPYKALIVGFGQLGQQCLMQMACNSQLKLTGARPVFLVVDDDAIHYQRFMQDHPQLVDFADIRFCAANVYSDDFARWFDEQSEDGIPLCQTSIAIASVSELSCENDNVSEESELRIASYIERFLRRRCVQSASRPSAAILLPGSKGEGIWTQDIVLHHELDRMAIIMNGIYSMPKEARERAKAKGSLWEDYLAIWQETSELNKDSSRAACDFIGAYLYLMGISGESGAGESRPDPAAAAQDSLLGPQQAEEAEAILQNDSALVWKLAEIEHLRWCAFFACEGYSRMPEDLFAQRIEDYLAKTGSFAGSSGKPHQDVDHLMHACLTSWEDLDRINEMYKRYDSKIACGETTVKGRDRDNLAMIPQLLRA